MRRRRLSGLAVAATAVICPCHALGGAVVALVALVSGSAPALSPELQDGIHALYVPAAVLLAARLLGQRLGVRRTAVPKRPAQPPA